MEASSRECMISLSSWEITKVQTAGQLAEAIIKKYLHNESLHADVDSVEKYFMDNDAPPNLYHIHQKRLSTARSPDASELVQPNG